MADEERMLLSSPLGFLLLGADASGLTCVRLVSDASAAGQAIISANTAFAAFARSSGVSSICDPIRPTLTIIVCNV